MDSIKLGYRRAGLGSTLVRMHVHPREWTKRYLFTQLLRI
jgi:hypothetical protein